MVYECVYVDGDLIGTRLRDADGVEIDQDGDPVPPRPAGVFPTAVPFQDNWLYLRRRGEDGTETLEMRQWLSDGSLVAHEQDGHERRYHPDGTLAVDGHRRDRRRHGPWRVHDPAGVLRLVEEYVDGEEQSRAWHRTEEEAGGRGVVRRGPLDRRVEVGLWRVYDAAGALIRDVPLGRRYDDEDLMASLPAADREYTVDELAEVLEGAERDDPGGAPAVLARARLAGRLGGAQGRAVLDALAHVPGVDGADRDWPEVDEHGEPMPDGPDHDTWAQWLHELRWGRPAAPILAALARGMLGDDRPAVALDLVDAALLAGDDPGYHQLRASCLAASGRTGAAADLAAHTAGVDHLDPEIEALLLAIRTADNDDTPRLRYAERVAHSHPAHAQLIRVQCAGEPDEEAVRDYLASLPAPVREAFHDRPVRGFVGSYGTSVDAEVLLRHADALLRAAPEVPFLAVSFASQHMAELSLLPALARYRSLSFVDTHLFGAGAAHLARSPYLSGLVDLHLLGTDLYDEDLTEILTSRAYPILETLDISTGREDQEWTLAGLAALPGAVFAPHLRSLAIRRRFLDGGVVDILAHLPALVSLDIAGNSLDDGALVGLAGLSRRFTDLDIHNGDYGDPGVETLAGSSVIERLERFVVGGMSLTDRGMATLVGSRHWGPLKELRLEGYSGHRAATADFAGALAGSALTSTLEAVHLSMGTLGEPGAGHLAGAPWQRLRALNLYGNHIGDRGVVALAGAPTLAGLDWLDLGDNDIGEEGGRALASSPHLDRLRSLQLGGAELSKGTRAALVSRFGKGVRFTYPWAR